MSDDQDVTAKLINDKEYRHFFFVRIAYRFLDQTVYEESVDFWISSVLHKRVYDTGIFLDQLFVCSLNNRRKESFKNDCLYQEASQRLGYFIII